MQFHAVPCYMKNTFHAVPCCFMLFHAVPCSMKKAVSCMLSAGSHRHQLQRKSTRWHDRGKYLANCSPACSAQILTIVYDIFSRNDSAHRKTWAYTLGRPLKFQTIRLPRTQPRVLMQKHGNSPCPRRTRFLHKRIRASQMSDSSGYWTRDSGWWNDSLASCFS